jgi:hypothetical protein
MRLLPRTPAPHPKEALFAYLLRLAEANCYPTPVYLAYAAGVSRTHWIRPYPSYPAQALAPLVSGDVEAFERLAYRSIVGNSMEFKLLDHNMGRWSGDVLRLMSPAICAECVREEGYISAFWDLAAAVACPRHARTAIERCQTCSKALGWYRPGLLKCRCNADICQMTGAAADEMVVSLMRLLDAKLERRSLLDCQVSGELPLNTFEAMPLFDFVRVIEVLGRIGEELVPRTDGTHLGRPDKVRRAANLLTQWPMRFQDWLVSLRSSHTQKAQARVLNRIDSVLFRRRTLSEGMVQLRRALSPVLSTVASRRSKVRPVKQTSGVVAPIVLTAIRIAGVQLGIPPQILAILRARGTYESKAEVGKRQKWRPEEIKAFGDRLLSMAGELAEPVAGLKLESLLALKFRNPAVKAEAVEAVLCGNLPVVGLSGTTPADLVLDAEIAGRWIREVRIREGGATYSMPEAATAIGVNLAAIPAAISAGLLKPILVGGLDRITVASVEEFLKVYVPVVSIARPLKTSVRRLVRFMDARSIKAIKLKRWGALQVEQPIVRREFQAEIEKLWLEEKAAAAAARKQRPDLEAQHMTTLSAFFQTVKDKGERLPSRAGRLDKSRIARACGFHRSEFDRRQSLAKMLKGALLEEQKRSSCGSLDEVDVLHSYIEECRRTGKDIPRTTTGKPNRRAIAAACGVSRGVFYRDVKAVRLIEEVA